MKQNEILAQLEKELSPLHKVLGDAADTILNEGVSNYPIFVTHNQKVEIGIPIITEEHQLNWQVNASTLEEFVAKNIISKEKIEDFKKVFKPIDDSLCLFVLSELGATFIFISRK